jgi:hypothetical protein
MPEMATLWSSLQIYGRHNTPSSNRGRLDEEIVCATGNSGPPCVASWGWSRSQGLGCSPIKAARELGLERRSLRPHGAICGCPPAHIGETLICHIRTVRLGQYRGKTSKDSLNCSKSKRIFAADVEQHLRSKGLLVPVTTSSSARRGDGVLRHQANLWTS